MPRPVTSSWMTSIRSLDVIVDIIVVASCVRRKLVTVDRLRWTAHRAAHAGEHQLPRPLELTNATQDFRSEQTSSRQPDRRLNVE